MTDILGYSRMWLGVPYVYGGNNPLEGLDCSGFVCWVLKAFGYITYHEDLSAQGLYNRFSKSGTFVDDIEPGCLLFFGHNKSEITHVAIALGDNRMIESGGGDQKCLTKYSAAHAGAMVRESPLSHRVDLVAQVKLPQI
jgi:cell wall-associated NlpC family hydrolase